MQLQQRLRNWQRLTILAFKKRFAALWFTPFTSNVLINKAGLYLPSCCCLTCPFFPFSHLLLSYGQVKTFYSFTLFPLFIQQLLVLFVLFYFSSYCVSLLQSTFNNTLFYSQCKNFDNILSFPFPGLFDIVMYFTRTYVIKPEMFVLFLFEAR